MVVAGLDIDHARALIGFGPGDHLVAQRLIGGEERMAILGHVEQIVCLVMGIEIRHAARHRVLGIGDVDAEVHAILLSRAGLLHAMTTVFFR